MASLAPRLIRRPYSDNRPPHRLEAHYRAERALADRIRAARTAEERRAIFATMYDELFAQVPDHPRLASKGAKSEARARDIAWAMAQLDPYLAPGCTFLEVGAGDCALSAQVAREAAAVYAVDISFSAQQGSLPANVRQVVTDGTSIEVPPGSVDVAFSDQLMEHLHPDDAREQLAAIHRALKPGGVYVCITPNRHYGPSDISAYFEDEARGFHLREYSLADIQQVLREAGFGRFHVWVGARGWFMRSPGAFVRAAESLVGGLPGPLRRRLGDSKVVRAVLGLRVAAFK
jgi:SAM-dependent methyltransferase